MLYSVMFIPNLARNVTNDEHAVESFEKTKYPHIN